MHELLGRYLNGTDFANRLISAEEMAIVTDDGTEWLRERQTTIALL